MLLNFQHFKEGVGALGASIFLLVSPQDFLYVLLGKVGWVDQTWNCIIRSELV